MISLSNLSPPPSMNSSKPPNSASTSTTATSPSMIDLTQGEYFNHQAQLPSPYKDLMGISKEDCINNFIQRRGEIIKRTTQIYQQTEDEKKQVLGLRELIFSKPLFQEAACVQNLLKNNDAALSRKILQELTHDIQLLIPCLQNLHEFYQAQKSPPSYIIESAWQQIYRASIYDPFLISKVCQLEWIFRAIEVLNHDRTDSRYPFVQYCELLKKGALASQNQEIIASQLSQKIEEELQRYQCLIQRVQLLLKQEGNTDTTLKMDAQQAHKLLQELKDFGFEMKQYTEYVEEVLKKASSIMAKFNEFLRKKALVSTNDLMELMLQINNSPIRLATIQEHIAKLCNDQEKQIQVVHQELAQRITEGNRELSLKYFKDVEEISICYGIRRQGEKQLGGTFGQEIQKITRYSEELIQSLQTFNFGDICLLSQGITERGYEHIKAELWLAKVRFLRIFCDSFIKPSNPITFEEICSFLPEIEPYVNSLPVLKRAPFNEQICFLHCLLHEIKTWIRKEQDKRDITGEGVSDKILYGFIDVTKEMATPSKHKRHPADLEFFAKRMQLQGQSVESLNRKRSSIDQLGSEIESFEKIEKKMKKKVQPEIVTIDSEDE